VRNLATEIRETSVPRGAISIWWLGQAGFVLKGQNAVLGIDLYLSDYPGKAPRAYAPIVQPAELTGMDVVVCTHDHSDHLDPWTLARIASASPKAVFVLPVGCLPAVAEILPVEATIGTRADARVEVGEIDILPIPAAHEAVTDELVSRRQGYIIKLDGIRVCHTGDTIMYDGLAERLQENCVDVLFAPINGRDYFRSHRGVVGNLDIREAADLAVAAKARLLVPSHWDLFPTNGANPGHLIEYLARAHPEQPCHYMARGERFFYFPGRETVGEL